MKNLTIVCSMIICLIRSAFSQTVSLRFDQTSRQQLYAASTLETALIKNGYNIKNNAESYQIDLAINAGQLGAESFSIKRAKQTITITGGDERGLIYGCLSLAEDIRNGVALKDCRTKHEKP